MLKRPDLDLASVQSEVAHFRSAKPELHLAFFKAEEVNGKACATPEQARRDIGAFIEDVYNAQRLQSALGYKRPVEFEAELDPSRNRQPEAETALSPNWPCLSRGVQSSILTLLGTAMLGDRQRVPDRCESCASFPFKMWADEPGVPMKPRCRSCRWTKNDAERPS